MSSPRPGHTGCHCCTDEAAVTKDITHRDLVTGDPHTESNTLDARELLFGTSAGDITGLTQETITQNCTATGSAVTRSGNGADATDGYLRMSVTDVVPSSKAFSVLQVVWTGETFNAFDHVDHIAAGSLVAYAAASRKKPSTFPLDTERTNLLGSNIEPVPVWGLIIRSGATLLVRLAPSPSSGGGGGDGVGHSCWRPLEVTGSSGSSWRILANGTLGPTLTATEARTYGLTVDPIATQLTHSVGFCFGIITGSDSWAGTLEASYSSAYDFDTINIYREYFLNCVAAFVNKTTLTASTPAHTGTSNCEPAELRGVSTTLTLETLPAWDVDLHSYALTSHHSSGYAYKGSTVVAMGGGDVTVTYWYTPCSKLTMSFDQAGGDCPAWVSIQHADEYTTDPCDGTGDNSVGQVTAPTIVGYYRREFYWKCYNGSPLQVIDDVRWYGVDCINHTNQTSPTQVDGIVGECHGTDMGETLPVCLEGDLPNQLPWMTDCWALDPIAIGYRHRITNVTSGFGGGGSDECGVGDPCDYAPDGAYRLFRSCTLNYLETMGFSFNLEYLSPVAEAAHFYVDITE